MWHTDKRVAEKISHDRKRPANIYDHVRNHKDKLRKLKQNPDIIDGRIKELEEQISTLTKRFQIQQRRILQDELEKTKDMRQSVVDGSQLHEYERKVRPFIAAHQKLHFCRPETDEVSSGAFLRTNNGSSILDDYMVAVEDSPPHFQIEQRDLCKKCFAPLQLYSSLSVLVCPKCGQTAPFLDSTAALLAYSDDSYEYCSFSYKRINHFNEWLAQFQGKESTDIPADILEAVSQRLWDERVKETSAVTTHKVRDVLKKLKLRKYYEHVQQITSRITGKSPPRMTPEQEEQCRLMFLAIQGSFERHCPPDRKNFLSYSYILFKFCQLLGYTQYLHCFSLLKGRDKLLKQDNIFERICIDLDWDFIPSVG